MPEKIKPEIKGKVDAVIQGALGNKGFKNLADVRNALSTEIQGGFAYNEYLNAIKNQIVKIATVNFIKIDVPILNHFWHNENGKIGDYFLQRQIKFARVSDYDSKLDVNDHFNPDVIEQVAETVYRKRFDLSISADIIAGAFNSYGDMNSFIDLYRGALENSVKLFWQNEQLKMFTTIPTIYKMTSDGSDGVATAKEIWRLITKMGMVTTYFNQAELPQSTSTSEMIIILNSKLNEAIQFDAVGSVFNFNSISNGGKIGSIYTYDFPDNDTVGVILTKDSFWLDQRINEATYQSWAKTLVQDNFIHHWVRALRSDFANMVRIVASTSTIKDGDKIDADKSPFTHYLDEKKTVKRSDDATIKDVTSYITQDTLAINEIPTNLMSLLPKTTITVTAAAATPTAAEIKTALKSADYRLDTDKITISDITTTSAKITAIAPYVVNSFKDYVDIKFTVSVTSGGDTGK